MVPKPEVFESESGQSFDQFLRTFEEYCRHTFRGSSSLWIGELGRLLFGDMKGAFDALKVPGDGYESLKVKLMKWRQDTHEVHEESTKRRFTKAFMRSGESLRLYAARLEKAFRLAYPSRSVETSKTLRRKYLDSVPNHFSKQLQTARSINLTMNQREIAWSTILTLASQQDAGDEICQDTVEKPTVDNQVWLNYQQGDTRARRVGYDGSPVTYYDSGQCPTRSTGQTRSRFEIWQSGVEKTPKRDHVPDATNNGHRRPNSPVRQPTRDNYLIESSNPRNGFVPEDEISAEARTCYYCHKAGHVKSQCRRYLNQCLVCGSGSHGIAGCPQRRFSPNIAPENNFSPQRPMPRSPTGGGIRRGQSPGDRWNSRGYSRPQEQSRSAVNPPRVMEHSNTSFVARTKNIPAQDGDLRLSARHLN